jgi:hypothetical protein
LVVSLLDRGWGDAIALVCLVLALLLALLGIVLSPPRVW